MPVGLVRQPPTVAEAASRLFCQGGRQWDRRALVMRQETVKLAAHTGELCLGSGEDQSKTVACPAQGYLASPIGQTGTVARSHPQREDVPLPLFFSLSMGCAYNARMQEPAFCLFRPLACFPVQDQQPSCLGPIGGMIRVGQGADVLAVERP